MIKISRMRPDSCQCVVEYETEYDEQGAPLSEPKFLLLNSVCDRHKPLASTTHRANHSVLSRHVIDLIEQAKERNLASYHDAVRRSRPGQQRRETEACLPIVQAHNSSITEEWNELVTQPYAFDAHIHEQIMKEQ